MNAPMMPFAKPWTANPDGYRVPYEVFTDQVYYDQEQEHSFSRGNLVSLSAWRPNYPTRATLNLPRLATRLSL